MTQKAEKEGKASLQSEKDTSVINEPRQKKKNQRRSSAKKLAKANSQVSKVQSKEVKIEPTEEAQSEKETLPSVDEILASKSTYHPKLLRFNQAMLLTILFWLGKLRESE